MPSSTSPLKDANIYYKERDKHGMGTEADIAAMQVKVENATQASLLAAKEIQELCVDRARTTYILENLVTTTTGLVAELSGTVDKPGIRSQVFEVRQFVGGVKRAMWIFAGVFITGAAGAIWSMWEIMNKLKQITP